MRWQKVLCNSNRWRSRRYLRKNPQSCISWTPPHRNLIRTSHSLSLFTSPSNHSLGPTKLLVQISSHCFRSASAQSAPTTLLIPNRRPRFISSGNRGEDTQSPVSLKDSSCSFCMRSCLMTSSVHDMSDNSEADEQQKHPESQIQSSPALGNAYSSITTPNVQYVTPQVGTCCAVAPAAYPYPDPYYRSIFAPYDAQPYPAQSYGGQPMVHLQLMGIQQAGVPLPTDAVEEPVFVNAKQYHGILRRRQSRAKAESEKKVLKSRKPYLHESRHLHALRRARGCGGRFVNSKKNENQQKEMASDDQSHSNLNLNSDKKKLASSDSQS